MEHFFFLQVRVRTKRKRQKALLPHQHLCLPDSQLVDAESASNWLVWLDSTALDTLQCQSRANEAVCLPLLKHTTVHFSSTTNHRL